MKLLTLRTLALLLASIAIIPVWAAAPWPEKQVRVIIPWPPGGSTDIVGRLVAAELGARLKQQVIIDNRSGAGGIVGMQIATQSSPDGYTLMLTSTAYGYLIDKQEAPVDLGGGPAIADVMAGHTQMYLGTLVTVMPQISSGRLKLLAVGGAKRNPKLPDVPTISETVPGYETNIWWGIFAPTGTPPAIIARIHAETTAALTSQELLRRFEEQGAVTAKMSSAEFGKLMVSETAKWSEVIKVAGIKGE